VKSIFRIGILRETKNPTDHRVPFSPRQMREVMDHNPDIEFLVQPSPERCYTDEEYRKEEIVLQEDLSECKVIMGIKEVKEYAFIPGKIFIFFAHVGKKQEHNRTILQQMIRKGITLVDYEYITSVEGVRLVSFGRWAGIIGAYGGMRAWGIKNGLYDLKPAWRCIDRQELDMQLQKVRLGNIRILLTGEGRVARGALEILDKLSIRRVDPLLYPEQDFSEPVFCQVGPQHYTRHRSGEVFDFTHFAKYPYEYESQILPYIRVSDMLLACHFWDPHSPQFFSLDDMRNPDFRPKVIADISCDPNGPIPSTIRVSTIKDPFYDFDPGSGKECPAFSSPEHVTVMAVDNLPTELPRSSSEDFGNALIRHVLPELTKSHSSILERATILQNGHLTSVFDYLQDFAEGL